MVVNSWEPPMHSFSLLVRSSLLLALFSLALSCSSSTPAPGDGGDLGPCGGCADGEYCCHATTTCEAIPFSCKTLPQCLPGEVPDYGEGPFVDVNSCEAIAVDCGCKAGPGLSPGVIGRYSSAVAQGDRLLVAAYEQKFGDLLLVSAQTSALDQRDYEIIDGVNLGDAPSHPTDEYRGGISSPGPDVGRGASLVAASDSMLWASYHDSTNNVLKFARRGDESWSAHVVAEPVNSEERMGLRTAMADLQGKPIIVYLVTGIALGNGRYASELRIASAASASPASASDWQHEAIAQGAMPCTDLCTDDARCFVFDDGSACREPTTNCDACDSGMACLAGECREILEPTGAEGPLAAFGASPRVLVEGSEVRVAFHDAVNGGVGIARKVGAQWQWSPLPLSSPNAGAFLSALIDGGGIHISYQDAQRETLHYALIDKATLTVTSEEVVDDGSRSDGKHAVGADSAIFVTDQGGIEVLYQDQTTVDLLHAKRGAERWEPGTDADPGRLLLGGPLGHGFYNCVATINGKVYGSTFWVSGAEHVPGGLEFFALP